MSRGKLRYLVWLLLVTAGVISADAWARTPGAELGKSSASRAEDNLELKAYYRAVLAALQILLNELSATSREEVDIRRDEWRRAYLNAPHGQPVSLEPSALGLVRLGLG